MSRPVDLHAAADSAPGPAAYGQGVAAPARHPGAGPELSTITAALARAMRAPSIHNTQPWRWRRGASGLELLADDTRWLAATDPDRTDLLISCGAMLHHARVAFASLGWPTVIDRTTEPDRPGHLALVEFARGAPNPDVVALSEAITRRFSNRAPYTSWEVPDGIVDILLKAGSAQGVTVRAADDGSVHRDLAAALAAAEWERRTNRGYLEELVLWTGAPASAHAGVPAAGFRQPTNPLNRQPFNGPAEGDAAREEDASVFLVIGTAADDVESRLRAGEATSAVLLEATVIGLATCPISLPIEVPEARQMLRSAVFGGGCYPQLIVRVGWAHVNQQPPPPTPRLRLESVFDWAGEGAGYASGVPAPSDHTPTIGVR